MKSRFVDWAYWILSFLPLVVTSILYPYFPNVVPVHWNAAGEVNRYGSKIELFIFPVLILVIAHFSLWFHSWINKGFKDKKQINAITKVGVIVVLNASVYSILFNTYTAAHSQATLDLYKIILIMLGLFNIILAYFMPKTRQNKWIGIRTKWTMLNEDIWRKTHRLGGWLLMIGGLISLITSLFINGFMCIYILLIIEILIVGTLFLYSYCAYKKIKGI